jgi:serine protease Do
MKYLLIIAAACAAFGAEPARPDVDKAVLKAEEERVAVIDRAQRSVLAIFSADGGGGGSGVVISADGYALTNFHVAKPCGNAMKCGLPDGKLYDAVIVGADPTGDIALIKLLGRDDLPFAELGDSDLVEAGDWVYVMGNPFLLAADLQPTVTYGIVSGVHRYQFPTGTLLEYTDCIQTDASINPGNSGGPLFNARGQLIGINGRASFEKRGRVNVGAGYAVSINQVNNFLGYLNSGRIVDHATLGARVALDDEGRVVVAEILETSDAYRRGLCYDDEIVSFAGRAIHTPNGFKNVLGIYPKGWRLPLGYRRDGVRHDVLVRLEGLHTAAELRQKSEGRRQSPLLPKRRDLELDKVPKGERDKDGGNGKDGKGPRKQPVPIPQPGDKHPIQAPSGEKPMPEEIKPYFEAKLGYANYHFNRVNRDRVWNAWAALADFSDASGAWSIAGPLGETDRDEGDRFSFTFDENGGSLVLPGRRVDWAATDNLAQDLLPTDSGGLLPTLFLWRRLAVGGCDKFGEVYYQGTAPLAGHEGESDVLIGIHSGVECRFYFDPERSRLLAIEMFAGEDADPCEVYFLDYEERDGRLLPGRMEVRFGDIVYGTFQFDRMQFSKGPRP